MKICVMRVPGTNRDYDLKEVFDYLQADADVVRMNQFFSREKKLSDYSALLFPGGFAHGDWIRSGAIWAKQLATRLGKELKEFSEEGKPILGICNGMQVLVETGLIPGLKRSVVGEPTAAMAGNASGHFECRWVWLKNCSRKSVFTKEVTELIHAPVAHGEGKFTLPAGKEKHIAEELEENQQIVFRYAKEDGSLAGEEYPFNPNGSFNGITGVSNPEGNVLALMPHLEDACFTWQLPDWTRRDKKEFKEEPALKIFKNLVESAKKF